MGDFSGTVAWPSERRPPPASRSRLAAPPPGTPYHRLARTRRFRWWVPPLAVVCLLALVLLTQLVLGIAGGIIAIFNGHIPTEESLLGSPLANLAYMLFTLATVIPLVLFTVRFVQWRPVGTLFSVDGRVRWRWFAVCALAALPAVGTYLGLLYAAHAATAQSSQFLGTFVGSGAFLPALATIVVLVPFQASAEEIGLRGFLMQALGSYGAPPGERYGHGTWARFLRTPVLGIAVSGTVFTLLHDYVGWGLVSVGILGLALAWLTWYTGGLEAAIGLHVLHNLAAFTLSAYEGTLDTVATGGGSLLDAVGTAAEVVLYGAVVVWLARRAGIRRTVPAAEEE
ncbi:membrane protease YdiL (CAAX protease family) [Haloactinospora alba]|uniref:Membrane protease YdiL (CAAX protease family) n=1 Tax=Haloactinospora alba TaxID=405555 RepID=A0A543NF39_9ACTN|nr:CPBP family intramembrane glutamic endopeptidase [Haloactinospora alba]TQN30468.1 membrane protease YdiL (CAAX protease family) [Haloactinospora alba]